MDRAKRYFIILQDLLQKRGNGYFLAGYEVCQNAFCMLRGVGVKTLATLKIFAQDALSFEGEFVAPVWQHGRTGKKYPSAKTMLAVNWVRSELQDYGEISPITGKVHVFMFFNPEALYCDFQMFCRKHGVEDHLKRSSFVKLMCGQKSASQFVKHFVFMRGVTQKVCGLCTALKTERMTCEDMEDWRKRREGHLGMIFKERNVYQSLAFSPERPVREDIHVLCMDESHPIKHPRKLQDTITGRSLQQMIGYFGGLIDHTLGRGLIFCSAGVGIPHFEDGKIIDAKLENADLFCSLLLSYIKNLRDAGQLRPHLYLQVDGGSAARNFTLFLLLGCLLVFGWVKQVTIASLIPGHTHVDIDGVFSIFWKKYRSGKGKTCRVWSEIRPLLSKAYPGWGVTSSTAKVPIDVVEIDHAWNFSEWFGRKGLGSDCLHPSMKGTFGKGVEDGIELKKPHKFVIELKNGTVVTSSFKSSVDSENNAVRKDVVLFKRFPLVDQLRQHDLQAGFEFQKKSLLETFQKAGNRLLQAGITKSIALEYENLTFLNPVVVCPFLESAEQAAAFGEKLQSARIPTSVRSFQVEESDSDEILESSTDDKEVFEVEEILSKKMCVATGKWMYQVRCVGYQDIDNIYSSDMGEGSLLDSFNMNWEAERRQSRRNVESEAFVAFAGSMVGSKRQREKDTQCLVCMKLFCGQAGLSSHQRQSPKCREKN